MQTNGADKVGVDRVLWKTRRMRIDSSRLVVLICLFALGGCVAKPVLEPRSSANPAGVDLSGTWRIRVDGTAPLAHEGEQPQTIQIPRRSSSQAAQPQQRRPRKSEMPDVWIFLETGKVLKVTQTRDGLFVSLDRSVVEEVVFGENRVVSVGPIEAQRVTGWVGPQLVVETMDDDGVKLTETWTLVEDGLVLVRDILIADGNQVLFSARQFLDKE